MRRLVYLCLISVVFSLISPNLQAMEEQPFHLPKEIHSLIYKYLGSVPLTHKKAIEYVTSIKFKSSPPQLSQNSFNAQGAIEALNHYPFLRKLNLYTCSWFTAQGLTHITSLINLQNLNLAGCRHITDDGLAHITSLTNLRKLDLGYCEWLTDGGLVHITSLINLQKLKKEGITSLFLW